MIKDIAKGNWRKIREWWKKRGDDQLTKTDSKREESIGILQKRYGYSKEKATSELDEHYPKARLR
jgi:uncharacterized protein YjbJ (UPF0337 family)